MDSDFFNPPLTERLKQILEKYPDGGQILKVDWDLEKNQIKIHWRKKTRVQLLSQEKLQNAEDAGASEVRFLLDPQSYSREKIMAPIAGKNDLARMQVTYCQN